jgi:glyoxylase-like metal-dependent hydrolase (beta-lactamase superfamily II)
MDDIRFNRNFPLVPGEVEQVAPGVRRLLAGNAGPFTFTGTVSYIVGQGQVAIIDPGPVDQPHIDALLNTVRGETVTHIVVTHTHRDHSPAAAAIKQATGARTYAEGTHRPARPLHVGDIRRGEGGDKDFIPDVLLKDGEVITGSNWSLEAIATPGHTANHMAFALRDTDLLFSGDHVMGWSTTVVAPPDGAMSDYMNSLAKLGQRQEQTYFPGHGDAVKDAPRFVAQLARHRLGREASILTRLAKGPTDIPALVRALYIGLDPRLVGGASLSVLAHLEDLVTRNLVATDDGLPSVGATYRLIS